MAERRPNGSLRRGAPLGLVAPLPSLLPSAPSAPPLTLLSATPHSPPRDLHPSPPGIQKWDIFAAEKWDIFAAD